MRHPAPVVAEVVLDGDGACSSGSRQRRSRLRERRLRDAEQGADVVELPLGANAPPLRSRAWRYFTLRAAPLARAATPRSSLRDTICPSWPSTRSNKPAWAGGSSSPSISRPGTVDAGGGGDGLEAHAPVQHAHHRPAAVGVAIDGGIGTDAARMPARATPKVAPLSMSAVPKSGPRRARALTR